MDFEPMEKAPGKLAIWAKRAVGLLALCVVMGLFAAMVKGFMSGGDKPRKMVQEVVLLRPPPPPPPPKPEERPPEPEMKKEEVKVEDKPIEKPPPDNEPPPALKPLGIDAEGSGAGDGFGLVGNRGGTDITLTAGREEGPGGNGNGFAMPEVKPEAVKDTGIKIKDKSSYAWYTTRLQSALQDALSRDEGLQGSKYKLSVRLWLDEHGGVSRVELLGSSGDEAIDSKIKDRLAGLTKLVEAPPEDLPQPLRVRITSRL